MTLDARLQKHIDGHRYPLVFATISGAHLYGFPSPDSDFDLRGVHCLPIDEVIGIHTGPETLERSGMDDGLEIDLVTHDIKKFMQLMLRRNGYVLEQLTSPLIEFTTPAHQQMCALVPQCVTKHHAHHYLGFAATQWHLFSKEPEPRVKPLLYVFRVLLTGIHLMRTGRVEANLVNLNSEAGLSYIPDLIALKTNGAEKEKLGTPNIDVFEREYRRLTSELEQAYHQSHLPDVPTAEPALHELLVSLRKGTDEC